MNNYLRLRAHLLYVTTRSSFSPVNNHPLLYAAKHNYLDVVQHLIEHGVDINTQNLRGSTALHIASYNGNIQMAMFLLANHAAVDTQNVYSNTALYYAVEQSNIEMASLLLSYGANLSFQCHFNMTPFEIAVAKYMGNHDLYLEMIKLLITHIVKTEYCSDVDTHLSGFIQNKRLINESEDLKELEQQCHNEIKQMCSISVGSSCLSFFDIFVLQKDINMLARCANNPDIVLCQNKFSMYSSFIEKSVEKGKARAKLLQEASESMDEIFESNQDASQEIQTSWLHLPPEVRLMILENLSNTDLTKLQHNDTAEAEAEAELEGAYAIYEEE
ncbi:ankyrin repeat domain-containing protein [Orientia tsutsugamushi]|uniref:Ankyrin repeat-containing protein n=1 Tax=Orientia tsutsugamushi TaxID=784 RepID=A0A2U3RHT6_ORITS|nr:ankyrin repeat domain-containing protein [Orientia tsutsugamushi]KJV91032.1 ankyrin repeat family protein [Orientia tsutsugamushi str. UT76]QES96096.1 PRANC domain-containing protein [Orientia tsutsugamushi]SPR12803.1 ankyrin repeat-containing protein [Orientia tsutsugamushi]